MSQPEVNSELERAQFGFIPVEREAEFVVPQARLLGVQATNAAFDLKIGPEQLPKIFSEEGVGKVVLTAHEEQRGLVRSMSIYDKPGTSHNPGVRTGVALSVLHDASDDVFLAEWHRFRRLIGVNGRLRELPPNPFSRRNYRVYSALGHKLLLPIAPLRSSTQTDGLTPAVPRALPA